jgi:hypothetical protein
MILSAGNEVALISFNKMLKQLTIKLFNKAKDQLISVVDVSSI